MPTYQTSNLFHFLGWQGGTIHQIASVIGCSSFDLIYSTPQKTYLYDRGRHWKGKTQAERNKDLELHRGHLEYWLGVRDSDLID